MTREEIVDGVLDAVAEAYEMDKKDISEASEYKKLFAYSSSKVLKTGLFIGENLDLDDDISYEDLADDVTIADTVNKLVAKLG